MRFNVRQFGEDLVEIPATLIGVEPNIVHNIFEDINETILSD